jgi:hypothetical protein
MEFTLYIRHLGLHVARTPVTSIIHAFQQKIKNRYVEISKISNTVPNVWNGPIMAIPPNSGISWPFTGIFIPSEPLYFPYFIPYKVYFFSSSLFPIPIRNPEERGYREKTSPTRISERSAFSESRLSLGGLFPHAFRHRKTSYPRRPLPSAKPGRLRMIVSIMED